MNSKGFGLQETLVFIGIFMFLIVAVAIYGRAKFSNTEKPEKKEKTTTYVAPSLDELTPVEIGETTDDYEELENKLLASSKHYDFNKEESIIISLEELKNSNLIDNIIDSNNNICDGYTTYNNENGEYKSYIICGNSYQTTGFDEKNLKK